MIQMYPGTAFHVASHCVVARGIDDKEGFENPARVVCNCIQHRSNTQKSSTQSF